uniref:CDI domain-containing protein n=1 Tax=Macrostomum lignano TaxID=282301 RepID=A0A1I8FRH9_9PLAT
PPIRPNAPGGQSCSSRHLAAGVLSGAAAVAGRQRIRCDRTRPPIRRCGHPARTLEADQWRSQYSRSFTGRGQEFSVALTDWQEKQTEALMRGASGGGSAMMEMFPPPAPLQQQRGHHSFEPPAAPGGSHRPPSCWRQPQPRLPGGLQGDSRAAAERVRPETDRERSERWLLEGRSTATCPTTGMPWCSNSSGRPPPRLAAGRNRLSLMSQPMASGLLRGTELTPRTAAMVGAGLGQRVGEPLPGLQQPGAIADTDARSDIAWLRRKYEPAASASWSFSDGAGLMNTLGLPGPALATCPADRGSTNCTTLLSSAAPAAQKQQPLQQAKSSKVSTSTRM